LGTAKTKPKKHNFKKNSKFEKNQFFFQHFQQKIKKFFKFCVFDMAIDCLP